eukprot:TRINITY_DN16063_c0_g1_i1.p1 TRINITY_DN16063_c0_g1~~TRINITY_DN16063_c0_g1_i1.p1  ORF type:complete len:152 (-),score=0.49 TRINITY_DN16063_c0_g1_i1:26-481(-)
MRKDLHFPEGTKTSEINPRHHDPTGMIDNVARKKSVKNPRRSPDQHSLDTVESCFPHKWGKHRASSPQDQTTATTQWLIALDRAGRVQNPSLYTSGKEVTSFAFWIRKLLGMLALKQRTPTRWQKIHPERHPLPWLSVSQGLSCFSQCATN